MLTCCTNCNSSFGYMLNRKMQCPSCKKRDLCWRCVNYPIIANIAAVNGPRDAIQTQSVCQSCFRTAVQPFLNLDAKYEVISPPEETPAIVSLVFVHGGGGCRKMYISHARDLAKNHRCRCVLLDLPGHGSRVNESLSLESSIATILEVTAAEAHVCHGRKPIYIGGSLGGYIGMTLLGRHPDVFSAAVICVAGQRTGIGASFKAKAGLTMFRVIINNFYAEKMLSLLCMAVTQNKHLMFDCIKESSLGTSMYFQQGMDQVRILAEENSAVSMASFRGPVLYCNGSLDHRDMERELLQVSQKGDHRSRLIDYDGADHFFSHDTRYYDAFLKDLITFIQDVL